MKIYYLIVPEERGFYFFENYKEAKAKETFLVEKYGFVTDSKFPNVKIPKYLIHAQNVKGYYGTIWVCYEFTITSFCHYTIMGRHKDIKPYKNENNQIKKIVIKPYEEFISNKDKTPLDKIKNMVKSMDLTALEEKDDSTVQH